MFLIVGISLNSSDPLTVLRRPTKPLQHSLKSLKSQSVYLLYFWVRASRAVRIVQTGTSKGRSRLTVKVQPVLSPVFGPILFSFLGSSVGGYIESGGRENYGSHADSGFGGTVDVPAFPTANHWRHDVTIASDSLQHYVQIAAQFD